MVPRRPTRLAGDASLIADGDEFPIAPISDTSNRRPAHFEYAHESQTYSQIPHFVRLELYYLDLHLSELTLRFTRIRPHRTGDSHRSLNPCVDLFWPFAKLRAVMADIRWSTDVWYISAWRQWGHFCESRTVHPWLMATRPGWHAALIDYNIRPPFFSGPELLTGVSPGPENT